MKKPLGGLASGDSYSGFAIAQSRQSAANFPFSPANFFRFRRNFFCF
jgi:hypothetical protein